MNRRKVALVLIFSMLFQMVPLPAGILKGSGTWLKKMLSVSRAETGGTGDGQAETAATGNFEGTRTKWSLIPLSDEEKKVIQDFEEINAVEYSSASLDNYDDLYQLKIEVIGEDAGADVSPAIPDFEEIGDQDRPWLNGKQIDYRQIKKISIGEGITKIGKNAFSGMDTTDEVEIASDVTEIGACAFYGCGMKNVTLPDGITTIGKSAFEMCTRATAINIPKNLTSIGAAAFCGCQRLRVVNIPEGIEKLPENCFAGCTDLQDVYFYSSEPVQCGDNVFPVSLYEEEKITIHYPENSNEWESEISDGKWHDLIAKAEELSTDNYHDNGNIVWSLQRLDSGMYCLHLQKETNAKSAKMRYYAWSTGGSSWAPEHSSPWRDYLDKIEKIEIGDGITNVAPGFASTTSGENTTTQIVTLSRDVTSLEYAALYSANFKNLSKINMEEGLKTIGELALSINSSKEIELELPETLEEIGERAFKGSHITSLTIPEKVTKIGKEAFSYASLTEITINGKLETLEGNVFENCTGLTKVTLPDTLKTIRPQAFYQCTSLVNISLPESLDAISMEAFSGTSIERLFIPEHVTKLWAAFRGMSKLKEIYFYGKRPKVKIPDGEENTDNKYGQLLDSDNENLVVYYLKKNRNSYRYLDEGEDASSESWIGSYGTVVVCLNQFAFHDGEISYELKNGNELVISRFPDFPEGETGQMQPYGSQAGDNFPLHFDAYSEYEEYARFYTIDFKKPDWTTSFQNSITTVTIKDGVSNISSGAFFDLPNLETVNISSSVETIDDFAFMNCTKLKKVNFESDAKLNRIGGFAFAFCKQLEQLGEEMKEINIPEKVNIIGCCAFLGCESIGKVRFAEDTGIDVIEKGTFCRCTSLSDIVLPPGTKIIEDAAFAYCEELEELTLPEGLEHLGSADDSGFLPRAGFEYGPSFGSKKETGVFRESGLTGITIPSKVKSIFTHTFLGCKWLKKLVIECSEAEIEEYAFSGMDPKDMSLYEQGISDNDQLLDAFNNYTYYGKDKSTMYYNWPHHGCLSLETVSFPNGVQKIGASAFEGCPGLRQVEAEDTIGEIEDRGFYSCTELSKVSVKNEIGLIGQDVFTNTKYAMQDTATETPGTITAAPISTPGVTSGIIPTGTPGATTASPSSTSGVTPGIIPTGTPGTIIVPPSSTPGVTPGIIPTGTPGTTTAAPSSTPGVTSGIIPTGTPGATTASPSSTSGVTPGIIPTGTPGTIIVPPSTNPTASPKPLTPTRRPNRPVWPPVDSTPSVEPQSTEEVRTPEVTDTVRTPAATETALAAETVPPANTSAAPVVTQAPAYTQTPVEDIIKYITSLISTQAPAATPSPASSGGTAVKTTTKTTKKATKSALPKGTVTSVGVLDYIVTRSSTTKGTVSVYSAATSTKKQLTIPKKVTIKGISYKVTGIYKRAFENMKKLTGVTIGSNVKTIGKKAFRNCSSIRFLLIPKNVTSIGMGAFAGCRGLRFMVIRTGKIKTVGARSFYRLQTGLQIKTPKQKWRQYRQMFTKKGKLSREALFLIDPVKIRYKGKVY